jgi:hypothetical protein
MARTFTAAERAAVAALHAGHFSKWEVQDADGVYRDYTQYLRTDWFTGATIEEHIDSNTMQLNARLKREVGTLSLSPFVAASLVNRNAGGSYATAVDAWRKWKLSVAVMREGYPPTGTDWKEICQGRIDVIEWSGDDIIVTGRGEEAVLLDFWIATERQYGSVGGIAMETVIQSMNDNNLNALSPTLNTPVSPSYLMNAWTQQKGNLFPADVAVAEKAGFKIRYRYDASDVKRLTLFKPDRTATPGSEVWTLGASEITGYQRVAIDKNGIRNFIKLRFVSPTLGIQTVIYPHMAGTGTVSCAAGVATFSSSQSGIVKSAADGSNTELIVAGIAYTVTAFNGTTGATLLSQLASGGTPAFGASAFTLHDTLSGAGTTPSLSRFGRTDLELDLSYDTQVNDSTKAQGMCDAVGSDVEFPDLEQQIKTLGAWFIQLHDYGKFLANGIHYDSDQYGGVTSIRHDIANATIDTTIGVRGKPAGGYRTWKELSRATVPPSAATAPYKRAKPWDDYRFALRATDATGGTNVSDALRLQGSILPAPVGLNLFTYNSGGPAAGKMWIAWTWGAFSIPLPDGTTIAVGSSTTLLPTPPSPTLSQVVSGALGGRTRFVRIGYIKNGMIMKVGAEASFVISANNLLKVTGIGNPFAGWYDGWTPLFGATSNTEFVQSSVGAGGFVAFGVDWTEPVGGGDIAGQTPYDNTFWPTAVVAAGLNDSTTFYYWPWWEVANQFVAFGDRGQTFKSETFAIKQNLDGRIGVTPGAMQALTPAGGTTGSGNPAGGKYL